MKKANIEAYDLGRRKFLKLTSVAIGALSMAGMYKTFVGSANATCGMGEHAFDGLNLLDPTTIPKYVNQLIIPPAWAPDSNGVFNIDAKVTKLQILPKKDAGGCDTGFGPTTVFAYGGQIRDPVTCKNVPFRFSPGATFDVVKGKTTNVVWTNNLTDAHFLPVDPTLHWANPNNMPMMMDMQPGQMFPMFPPGFPLAQKPVPMVTHLHGGEVPSIYDGGPDAWFTADGKKGPTFVTRNYKYPNEQEATTLFYHDHVLGMTRLNLYAGLAGFYLIRDPSDKIAPLLPQGKYEVPLAIQDRIFFEKDSCGNNDLAFPYVGNVPDVHPYWNPEFFGEVSMINGQAWPNLNVDKGQYRFRIVNGSNARFYTLAFSNGMSFVQIGSDGGYLKSAVKIKSLTIAPGERADILVDFTGQVTGTKIVLMNSAPTPFPAGTAPDANTIGQIMQFTVGSAKGFQPKTLPSILNPTLTGESWPGTPFPTLPAGRSARILTLMELLNPAGQSLGLFLNGQKWSAPITEKPTIGSTEDWQFVNLTGDAHPMHLHLTQFQLISRQPFNAAAYLQDWYKANSAGLTNGDIPLNKPTRVLPVKPYLRDYAHLADANERGWKDVVRSMPGEVTTVRVRFKRQDGQPYGFDASQGPGYVWHCHIVDHEDNEMMRPLIMVK